MNGQDYSNMIYKIAHKYSFGVDFEDLCQVGQIGLMKAYEKYDKSYGSDFSSYAYIYIKGEILKYIKENRVVKISNDLFTLNKSIAHAMEVLTQKNMKMPTNSELALFLEIPEEKINEAMMATEYVKSLDYVLNDDDDKELTLYDSIKYEEKGYDERILDLKEELSLLDENEKKLIMARYYEDKSQQETSELLGISQVQVSRNESKILTKLRSKLAS